jgi:hypothetical protein
MQQNRIHFNEFLLATFLGHILTREPHYINIKNYKKHIIYERLEIISLVIMVRVIFWVVRLHTTSLFAHWT